MLDYFLSRFNSFSLKTHGLTKENFPSRIRKEFFHSPNSSVLIITAPAWGMTLTKWMFIKKWINKSNLSFLGYEFPRGILSNDHILTEEIFKIIKETVSRDIEDLKIKYKFKKCVIVGLSLGSSFGSMIYKENRDITDIVLVCPGNNLALNMWNGCRTQHLRKSYEKQEISLEQLKSIGMNLLLRTICLPHILTLTLCMGIRTK